MDIVVVNFKTPGDLFNFGDTLPWALNGRPTSVRIVNVCPEPEDRDVASKLIEQWQHYDIEGELIEFEDNVGYATACNAASSGEDDYIGFFNADVSFTPGSLVALEDHIAWQGAAVIGPKQVDDRGRIVHAGMFGTNQKTAPRGWHEQNRRGLYNEIEEAITVAGSAYIVRRTVWDEMAACPQFRNVAPNTQGAFLPTLHYYEETWFSYHCRAHGYTVLYDGAVTIKHRWHQASPVGGWAEQQLPTSQEFFRRACSHHGILCD